MAVQPAPHLRGFPLPINIMHPPSFSKSPPRSTRDEDLRPATRDPRPATFATHDNQQWHALTIRWSWSAKVAGRGSRKSRVAGHFCLVARAQARAFCSLAAIGGSDVSGVPQDRNAPMCFIEGITGAGRHYDVFCEGLVCKEDFVAYCI